MSEGCMRRIRDTNDNLPDDPRPVRTDGFNVIHIIESQHIGSPGVPQEELIERTHAFRADQCDDQLILCL